MRITRVPSSRQFRATKLRDAGHRGKRADGAKLARGDVKVLGSIGPGRIESDVFRVLDDELLAVLQYQRERLKGPPLKQSNPLAPKAITPGHDRPQLL